MKSKSKEIEKLRYAFKAFLLAKIEYRFDKGEFDNEIKNFWKKN